MCVCVCSQLTVANQLTDLRAHLASGMIRQQLSADLSPCLEKSSRPHGNVTGMMLRNDAA